MKKKILFFSNKIKFIFLLRIKNKIFNQYKQSLLKNELEELKIYNIKPKESYEVIVLKEKYVNLIIFIQFVTKNDQEGNNRSTSNNNTEVGQNNIIVNNNQSNCNNELKERIK